MRLIPSRFLAFSFLRETRISCGGHVLDTGCELTNLVQERAAFLPDGLGVCVELSKTGLGFRLQRAHLVLCLLEMIRCFLPRLPDRLLRFGLRPSDDLARFCFRLAHGLLGFAARGGPDLFGTLARALEDALRLFADLLEGVLDRALGRARLLELCDDLPHAAHVAVDGFAVVAAPRNGEVRFFDRVRWRVTAVLAAVDGFAAAHGHEYDEIFMGRCRASTLLPGVWPKSLEDPRRGRDAPSRRAPCPRGARRATTEPRSASPRSVPGRASAAPRLGPPNQRRSARPRLPPSRRVRPPRLSHCRP